MFVTLKSFKYTSNRREPILFIWGGVQGAGEGGEIEDAESWGQIAAAQVPRRGSGRGVTNNNNIIVWEGPEADIKCVSCSQNVLLNPKYYVGCWQT